MRLIWALALLFSVLIDFSASCLAEDFSVCHLDDVSVSSVSDFEHDVTWTTENPSPHTHPQGSDSHHCHGGHLHAALNSLPGSVASQSSLNFALEFFDYSLFIPSPSLSEIIRPPITA